MLAGELYDSSDPLLAEERKATRSICSLLNSKDIGEVEKNALIKKLFDTDTDVFVTPPFYCDYGKNISLDGIFIAIGMLPQNEIALSLGIKLNKKGELIIDRLSKTNVEGVFAAGDVTDAEWKQGIIASAEGSVAAYSAFEYINKKFH